MTSAQRKREAALALPLLGALLLFSPLAVVFARPVTVLGVPLLVVYLFGVWFALIAGAFLLARRLPSGPR